MMVMITIYKNPNECYKTLILFLSLDERKWKLIGKQMCVGIYNTPTIFRLKIM